MNWLPSVCGPIVELNAGMERICVVSSLKDADGLSLHPFTLIQCVWPQAGSPSRFSGICLIWAFCVRLSSASPLKGAALLLFASLLSSEENDNNEAWRLSTTSHKNIHTYNTRNTFNTIYATHTHPYLHTYMQCEINTGSHKLLFVQIYVVYFSIYWNVCIKYCITCHCFLFYCNSAVELIEKLLQSILQNLSLFGWCSPLIRLHNESRWVAC